MEITVKGEPQEIAALVVAIRERRGGQQVRVTIDRKEILKDAFGAMRDKPQEHDM